MNGILANLPEEASIVEIVQLLDYIRDQLWRYQINSADIAEIIADDPDFTGSEKDTEDLLRHQANAHTTQAARHTLLLARDFIIDWGYAPDEEAETIYPEPELPHQAL